MQEKVALVLLSIHMEDELIEYITGLSHIQLHKLKCK